MLDDFKKHIDLKLPSLKASKVLLAVSGGLDSMVLAHLCLQSGYTIAIAHCNFNLRGKESDEDATFVKAYCNKHNIPYYTKSFLTKDYATTRKLSTQMAARDLRYNWFNDLMVTYEYDFLLTAHHLNDSLETFLINLARGTGLSGLTGIPEESGRTIRPLLPFSRKRIHTYALKAKIDWREDSSNASDDYLRNHLRHHAIPALEEAQSSVLIGFAKTQEYLQESERLLKVYDAQLRQQYTRPIRSIQGTSGLCIDLNKIAQHPEVNAVLHRLLVAFNFTAWEDVYALPSSQSGKQIFSSTHRLLKNRDTLEVHELKAYTQESYTVISDVDLVTGAFGRLAIDHPELMDTTGGHILYVRSELLHFPLTIRRWEEGDYFYPYGMKGKKKLSKYFKDEKLSLVEKERVWVLCSDGDIVWVIGYRADDRFKVTQTSKVMTRFIISYEATND